jgi:NDP-sugar pyrophosphorylase family protein
MKIIVPMAGLGTRFQKVADTNPEYKKPKPFILVRDTPMVRWATGALPFIEHPGQIVTSSIKVTPKDLIFIVLKEHNDVYNLEQGLKEIYSDAITVIIQPERFNGASKTTALARHLVDPEEDIIITDSDHYFDGAPLEEAIIKNKGTDVAGIIPVFTPPNDGIPRWSYSLTEESGTRILNVGEKDRALMEAGAFANIGAYYFSKAKYFFETSERAIRENRSSGDEGKKEFYIAPNYQDLLNEGKHVEAAILPEVWGLGTPSDLEYFLANCKVQKP